MRRATLAACAVLALAGPALGEPPDANLYAAPAKAVHLAPSSTAGTVGRVLGEQRPADCYHIPWCGCWLRHHLHIKDVRLNLAHNWSVYWGRSAGKHPAVGYVAVFIKHHVGIVTGVIDAQHVMILSGNDGHAVRERPRDIRTIAEFRAPT